MATTEANDQLLGLHVAAEMDLRSRQLGREIRMLIDRADPFSTAPNARLIPTQGSHLTPRWREMDSNFQYASTVRWHRATDLPLPPTVKRSAPWGARLPWRDRVPRCSGVS
jgi:hypothetical protein